MKETRDLKYNSKREFFTATESGRQLFESVKDKLLKPNDYGSDHWYKFKECLDKLESL